MNTKIEYLYRDFSDNKKSNVVIVAGEISESEIESIILTCDAWEYFIPSQVGLPEKKFETWTADDHPWFEIHLDSFEAVDAPPTVDLTARQLVENFRHIAEVGWNDKIFDEDVEDEDSEEGSTEASDAEQKSFTIVYKETLLHNFDVEAASADEAAEYFRDNAEKFDFSDGCLVDSEISVKLDEGETIEAKVCPAINLGEFDVEVERNSNGLYDIWLSRPSDSGMQYRDLTKERIGEVLIDFIECIEESMDDVIDRKDSGSASVDGVIDRKDSGSAFLLAEDGVTYKCSDDPNAIDDIASITGPEFCARWVRLGEGYSGDYDPDDPDDEELLRFDILRKVGSGELEEVDDASYCTYLPASSAPYIKLAMLDCIYQAFCYALRTGRSTKKVCERLSCVASNDFCHGYNFALVGPLNGPIGKELGIQIGHVSRIALSVIAAFDGVCHCCHCGHVFDSSDDANVMGIDILCPQCKRVFNEEKYDYYCNQCNIFFAKRENGEIVCPECEEDFVFDDDVIEAVNFG